MGNITEKGVWILKDKPIETWTIRIKKKVNKHFKERCKKAQNSEANTIQLNIKCKVKHLQFSNIQIDTQEHSSWYKTVKCKIQNQVYQKKGITSRYYQRWHWCIYRQCYSPVDLWCGSLEDHKFLVEDLMTLLIFDHHSLGKHICHGLKNFVLYMQLP